MSNLVEEEARANLYKRNRETIKQLSQILREKKVFH